MAMHVIVTLKNKDSYAFTVAGDDALAPFEELLSSKPGVVALLNRSTATVASYVFVRVDDIAHVKVEDNSGSPAITRFKQRYSGRAPQIG